MAPGITTGIRSKRRFKLYFSRLLPRLYYVWETEMFNEFFYFYGRRYSRFLTIWFSLGIGVSLLVSLAVILILIWHWSWLIFPGNQNNALVMNPGESRNSITLVVPGLNVPWSDIGYILFGTIIAVGFHEVGHALAAASEGVRIEHVAVFLACLFPGALVGLNHSSLQLLPPIRALRIYCAGIWHNVVCCAGCCLMLILLPVILHPFYLHITCPVVLDISSGSPLAEHISPGHMILDVGGLQPESSEDWIRDLHMLRVQSGLVHNFRIDGALDGNTTVDSESSSVISTQGFCVPKLELETRKPKAANSTCWDGEFSFYKTPYLNTTKLVPEIKDKIDVSQAHLNGHELNYCLRSRDVVRYPTCDREKVANIDDQGTCPNNDVCMFPELQSGELLIEVIYMDPLSKNCSLNLIIEGSRTRLSQILAERVNYSGKNDCLQSLIFAGDPMSLAFSLQLTNYWPRNIFMLGLFNVSTTLWFPVWFEKLITYIFYISSGVGLLNSVPVLLLLN
eukprot:c24146_g1_i3 orf=242-1765(+)